MPIPKKSQNAFGMKTGTKASRAPKLSKSVDARLQSMTPEQQKRFQQKQMQNRKLGR